MKTMLLLSLFIFASCALAPEQNFILKAPIVIGTVDIKNSSVKLFSNDPDESEGMHFYLELRNSEKGLVDVEEKDIVVKVSKNILKSHVQRLSIGKYKVGVLDESHEFKSLKFSVQKKLLKHQLLVLKKPHRKNSSIKLLSNQQNRLRFSLSLKDKQAKAVEVHHLPEIILEGSGEVSEIKMVRTGVWEVEVVYPDENQILYLSVRANRAQFDRLFRYQHVEK